jgi:glycolate oxidase
MTGADVLKRLSVELPDGVVLADAASVASRSSDRSGVPGGTDALAVVRPRTTADVSAVLAAANEARVPVVPQGALTGLAGAANAVSGALLLDLSGMNRIVQIDETERIAVMQPGVIVADLQAAVAERGLFYAPDPASAELATIGGTVATNAGGMRAVKYGVTRDSVRSLEVVLADGAVVRTRRNTIKSVAGLDLTGLVVGSEGTLAVITEVTVTLLPAPAAPRGVAGTFHDLTVALEAANAVVAGGTLPATLELLDGVALDAIRRYLPQLALPQDAQAWLLAVTDAGVGAEAELGGFEEAFRSHGALTVQRADTAADLDGLLEARRALNPALRALRGSSLNGDIAVPRARLCDFVEGLGRLAIELDVVIAVGGHVGDGNLHPVVAYNGDDPHQALSAQAAHDRILRLAQGLGGSMTGEHGVGVEKLSELDGELSARVRDMQRAIKAVFDPNGILNPGKKY